MPEANIDATKRAIDAFNRRDTSEWENDYTDDYQFYPRLMGAVEGESFQGRDGVERYYGVIEETFEEWRVAGEEFRELHERVLVRARVEGCGKGSAVPMVGWQSILFDFRDGKICRVRSYRDESEALAAVASEERQCQALKAAGVEE